VAWWYDGGQGEKRCQSPFFAADGGIQAGVRRWLSPGLQRNCGRLQLREADRPRLGGLGASEAVFTALPNHQCEDGAAVRQYRRTLVYVHTADVLFAFTSHVSGSEPAEAQNGFTYFLL